MAYNISRRIFGPTTVHLEHETYLLISLAILEFASIQNILFTALVTAWLSRNLIVRWLLTAHDTLTITSERSLPILDSSIRFQINPIENLIDFISTTVLAGQTFDRPNPHFVAKFVGTNHTAADMIVENDLGLSGGGSSSRNAHRRGSAHGGYNGGGDKRSYAESAWDFCETTFYKVKDSMPSSLAVASSEVYWTNLARTFGPSPQLLLQVTTLCFLYFSWVYPLSEEGGGFVRYFSSIYTDVLQVLRDVYNIATNRDVIYYHYGRHDTTSGPLVSNHALILETLNGAGPAMGYSGEITIDNTQSFGMYQHTFDPTYIDLSYYIILCGICLSMAFYGRILLPIPDLVAGSNTLSASKESAGSASGSRGGGGSGAQGPSAHGGGGGDTIFVRPWLEQYQSIVTEQRLKLILKVAFIRVVENLFLIAILPRTDLACKTTGQCPNKSGWKEMAKVMFHAGITSPLRSDSDSYQLEDGKRPFSVGENPNKPNTLCATMIGISVVVITLSLLLAQAATLNRSHLGINGYLAGGWIVASETDDSSGGSKGNANETNTPSSPQKSHHHKSKSPKAGSHKKSSDAFHFNKQPSEWVPRKRYRKGDMVSFEGTLYKATVNNPEGKPYEFFLWLTHKLFRNELGHPATSRVIAFASTVQFGLVSILILLILSIQLLEGIGSFNFSKGHTGINPTITCLLWTLAANLVAVYGTVSVGLPNYSELGALAEEINRE